MSLPIYVIPWLASPRRPTGEDRKGPGAGSLFDGLFHRQTEELFGMEDSYGHTCTFKHHPATDITIASLRKRDEVLKMSTTYVLKSKNQILRSGLRAICGYTDSVAASRQTSEHQRMGSSGCLTKLVQVSPVCARLTRLKHI